MRFYELSPEFGCSYMYGEFYRKVGGSYWKDIQNAANNLLKALQEDREFLLSMVGILNHETKDEFVDVVIEDRHLLIKMICLAQKIEYKTVVKTVVVDGEEYTKNVSVREDHEWHPRKNERAIPFSALETSD